MNLAVRWYLNPIDAPWVQETVSERFDNATELMPRNAIVFGGALRDLLAGLPATGDLDISVSANNFKIAAQAFRVSPKWVRKVPKGLVTAPESSLPGEKVLEFFNILDNKVQLTSIKNDGKDDLHSALQRARTVDIICCGIVMLSDGRVFETVPGAYHDCQERILRLNEQADPLSVEKLASRIKKFEKRGWKNEIDLRRIKRFIKRKEKLASRSNNLPSSFLNDPKRPHDRTVVEEPTNTVHVNDPTKLVPRGAANIVWSSTIIRMYFNSQEHCFSCITEVATKLGINIRVKRFPMGDVLIETYNERTLNHLCHSARALGSKTQKKPWNKAPTATGKPWGERNHVPKPPQPEFHSTTINYRGDIRTLKLTTRERDTFKRDMRYHNKEMVMKHFLKRSEGRF